MPKGMALYVRTWEKGCLSFCAGSERATSFWSRIAGGGLGDAVFLGTSAAPLSDTFQGTGCWAWVVVEGTWDSDVC